MTQKTAIFKDFMITELSPRMVSRQASGQFLVCRPVKDPSGNLSLDLNLPESVRRQMLEAIKQGQLIRLFSSGH